MRGYMLMKPTRVTNFQVYDTDDIFKVVGSKIKGQGHSDNIFQKCTVLAEAH